MKTINTLFTFVLILLVAISCKEKERPVYVEADVEETGEVADNYDIAIPYREENGVKYLAVEINGLGCEMIFDTGCSSALISVAEATYLYQKGLLTEDDILGVAQNEIADGSVKVNAVVNLSTVTIGGQLQCTDVRATVSDNPGAPLLLGNEILNRAASYTIDNENRVIKFKLKE